MFSADGAMRREIPLTGISTNLELVGRNRGGALLFATQSALLGSESPGIIRTPRTFVQVRGSVVDTVAVLPGFEYEVTLIENGSSSLEIPFARMAHGAAFGERMYMAANDHFEIGEYNSTGRLTRLIRYPGGDRRITDHEVATLEKELIDYLDPTPKRRANILRLFRETRRPPLRPAFSGLLGDSDGNLWVVDWVSGFAVAQRGAAKCTVFNAEGQLLGEVTMPPGFRPLEVGVDYIIGVSRDDAEVERVDIYRLNRTAN